jgi:hypothetical protein
MRGELLVTERLYGALLHLYPKEFRAAYGRQMRLTFRDACRVAYGRNGARGLLALWLPTLLDLFKSALEERVRQGELTMSKERLMTLAGTLSIIVGLLWVLASIGEFVLLVGLGSPDSFWDVFWVFPVLLSFILMIPAFILTRQRHQESAGGIGRLGLTLNVAGCVGMFNFILVSFVMGAFGIEQHTWPNYVIAACVLTLMSGHVLFGIDALRNKLLPRWNVMPLLVGLPTMLLIGPSLLIDGSTPNHFELTLITTFLRFSLTGVCWILLGIALMDQNRSHSQQQRSDARLSPGATNAAGL